MADSLPRKSIKPRKERLKENAARDQRTAAGRTGSDTQPGISAEPVQDKPHQAGILPLDWPPLAVRIDAPGSSLRAHMRHGFRPVKQISSPPVSRIPELRSRIQRRTLNVYDTAFTRRVSIYFTVVLARLRVTPNQVSALGALVGAASCALIAFGSPIQLLIGVALLHLYAVLDSVDGELARMTQRFSLVGLFVEDLSAYLMINQFNLAVAWRLYQDGALVWPLIGAVGIAAFGRNVMPVARRALIKSIMTRRPPQLGSTTVTATPRSRFREFIQENVVHVTNQWMLVSALLALSVYDLISTEILALVFGLFLGLFACREIVALVVMLRKDRLEHELSAIYAAACQSPELDGQRLSGYQVL